MEFEDFNYDNAKLLFVNFVEKAQEIDADTPTMLFATLHLFMTLLKLIITPDPRTGRKFKRAMTIVPTMMILYNNDFPMDETKEG